MKTGISIWGSLSILGREYIDLVIKSYLASRRMLMCVNNIFYFILIYNEFVGHKIFPFCFITICILI